MEYDRIEHITSLTVNAFDLFELTVDEVHDTIFNSHTANIVLRTWFVSSKVILNVRNNPIVLQRVATLASRVSIVIFLWRYYFQTSSITNELETIVPTSHSSNSNFSTDWENSWIKYHLVAKSLITKIILNCWVVIWVVRNNLQTRNGNTSSENFVL